MERLLAHKTSNTMFSQHHLFGLFGSQAGNVPRDSPLTVFLTCVSIYRPCFSSTSCWCLWPGPRKEAISTCQNGEERNAQYGVGRTRKDGSRCKHEHCYATRCASCPIMIGMRSLGTILTLHCPATTFHLGRSLRR